MTKMQPAMRTVHQRLFDEIRARSPGFEPSPETEERIAATEAWLRVPLPDDYRAFLRELGRVSWPLEIGNVLDVKAKDWPTAFVPFARGAAAAHGFFLMPRHPIFDDLAGDLRARATAIEDRIEGAREDGELTDDLEEDLEGEARALRREAEEADEREAERKQAKSTDLRIETVSLVTRELRQFPVDEADKLESFTGWLERTIASAARREEAALRPTPPVEVAEPESAEAATLRRALDLLDRLIAAGHLEVGPDFDDAACARLLVPVYGDAGRTVELLVDLPGVEELFASEDDLETLVTVLALDA